MVAVRGHGVVPEGREGGEGQQLDLEERRKRKITAEASLEGGKRREISAQRHEGLRCQLTGLLLQRRSPPPGWDTPPNKKSHREEENYIRLRESKEASQTRKNERGKQRRISRGVMKDGIGE